MPTIRIDIPALDRLLDYLEGIDQAQIDASALGAAVASNQ